MEKRIRSRADFQQVLGETFKRVGELVPKKPDNKCLEEIWYQLEAMQRWTKDGRDPTTEERKRIKIGPLSFYDLCPKDDDGDVMSLRPTLSELHWYFVDWPPA
jgi:hypothetical protein